ncbi:2-dehydro-3-deoxy-6-phosphogalactonate aldolase [Leeia oryzae]|uniref:2-dehydro-3-deoxy-6-phosphogalactonate aldolase n=1 Tax=Leeia oryzae TaxID=356662 RepID=UPI000365C992|nr:2-dehydro-3-deoxy-6-phosphogalactonate aldolase [Leeia oryzae]
MNTLSATPAITLNAAMADLPLVAILRGIQPDEIHDVAAALYNAGWRMVEVPLNSPDPLETIRRLSEAWGDRMVVGAGTVLTPDAVAQVAAAGGRLIVSPNLDLEVVAAAKARGLYVLPGVQTATECFLAHKAGADGLKLFPGESISIATIKALKTVLPADARLLPVGGVTLDNLQAFKAAGVSGFGIGGALYKPGMTAAEVKARAEAFAGQYRATASV